MPERSLPPAVDPVATGRFLEALLVARLAPDARAWVEAQLATVTADPGHAAMNRAVSLVVRRLGKADLRPVETERVTAPRLRAGWILDDWTVDQTARVLFLLRGPGGAARLAERLEHLCTTGDLGELVAFYRGLPLYPEPSRYLARAQEGARTSMKPVFEAVAHNNPYPAEQFPQDAWNQLVLKALFIGSLLHPIHGLDERACPALATMLCRYAHERWAAGRPVTPELWRCVGPHAKDAELADLERALTGADLREARGAALALAACPLPRATQLLGGHPELARAITRGTLRWATILDPCDPAGESP